jgi:hypothetical protein
MEEIRASINQMVSKARLQRKDEVQLTPHNQQIKNIYVHNKVIRYNILLKSNRDSLQSLGLESPSKKSEKRDNNHKSHKHLAPIFPTLKNTIQRDIFQIVEEPKEGV